MEVVRQDEVCHVRLPSSSSLSALTDEGTVRYRLEAMDFTGIREACVEADAESSIPTWRDQKVPLKKAGGLVKTLWE